MCCIVLSVRLASVVLSVIRVIRVHRVLLVLIVIRLLIVIRDVGVVFLLVVFVVL